MTMRTADEALLSWARAKYNDPNITAVKFQDAFDYGYSEMTPGEGATTEIYVKYMGAWRYAGEEKLAADLINDILKHVVE